MTNSDIHSIFFLGATAHLTNNTIIKVKVKVKSLSHVWTLCNPMDCSLPGSSIHGIFQSRILEWGAISFSNTCIHAKSLQSCPTLFDSMGSSPPSSSVHGILQVRILEWVAISFSLMSLTTLNYYKMRKFFT